LGLVADGIDVGVDEGGAGVSLAVAVGWVVVVTLAVIVTGTIVVPAGARVVVGGVTEVGAIVVLIMGRVRDGVLEGLLPPDPDDVLVALGVWLGAVVLVGALVGVRVGPAVGTVW
jgi:hypothetical protein